MRNAGLAGSPDAYPTRPGESFDPLWLQTPATLNRSRLAPLVGAESEWVGRRAFELLSLEALRNLPAGDVPNVFGRRLGHLVATLHGGAQLEPDGSEWRRAYLDYWSTVREVWLGGGVAAELGPGIASTATAEAAQLGATRVAIELAKHPAELALIGAARSNMAAAEAAIVLDFGHTAIKRGVARYVGHALAGLDVLPALTAPADRQSAPAVAADAIDALRRHAPEADRRVVASVASYVNPDGTLAESHSRYALLTPSPMLTLGHDGTLAARGIQPTAARAAVIMLGTALGVGFAPPTQSLRALHPDFEVRVLRAT